MTPAKPSLSDPHLLVVDDDERLRALLTRYLSANGFRVSAAASAADARTLMKSIAFDCLTLDVMMPGESGLDLPKPFEPRELLLRINALLRRATPVAETASKPVRMGEAVYDPAASRLTRGGKPVKLTSSEAALLQLFTANAGHPFSRSDLCTRLGVALERSIDVQVTRLRRKIEEDPKLPLYLQTVRGVGYVLVPDRN